MSEAYEHVVVCQGNLLLSRTRLQHQRRSLWMRKGDSGKELGAGFDLEKAAHHGATSSGENLSTGGILSLNLQKVGSAAASPSRAYINCLYDAVCELKDSGAFVYS